MKIFHLDCSVNDFEHSLTRKHSKMIADKLLSNNRNSEIYYIDLIKANIPFLNKEYQQAMFKPEKHRTDADNAILSTFNIKPFHEADIYVLGVPGYLFNVPAIFKNWMEHTFRIDTTLDERWEGLLKGKKMFVVSAWGGIYTDTRVEKTYENSIRSSFKIFGIEDITFFNIFNDRETKINNIYQIKEAIEAL
ncbi:MAG: NAD(P)H-dependent oxidoreductase [Alphaproteobacteria bacterium]